MMPVSKINGRLNSFTLALCSRIFSQASLLNWRRIFFLLQITGFFIWREKVALGTKVVVYYALGLPVLLNSNFLSASDYVNEYQTGLVINIGAGDSDKEQSAIESSESRKPEGICSGKEITRTANSNFSNE